ncbi:MAG: DUF58 domain-containing protein, partial [Planctomycetota bacterium]
MFRPSPEVHKCSAIYRLALPEQAGRGIAGEHLGRGTGSSLEFQDRRTYSAGDDVRHIDWRAYGRTDQLFVRVYREEIQPRVEVLLDISKSIAIDEKKAKTAIDTAALLYKLAKAGGFTAKFITLSDRAEPLEIENLETVGIDMNGRRPLAETAREAFGWLGNGALRFLISDFMSPHEAPSLVRPLAARAGKLTLIQILTKEEREPAAGEALRLTDSESDEFVDLILDESTIRDYKKRLQRLASALDQECRRARGQFVSLT